MFLLEPAVKSCVEDAGCTCSKCNLPLELLTFAKSDEALAPITLASCPNCGLITCPDELYAEHKGHGAINKNE